MPQFCEEAILNREFQSPSAENLAAQFAYFWQVYIVIVICSPPRTYKLALFEHFESFL